MTLVDDTLDDDSLNDGDTSDEKQQAINALRRSLWYYKQKLTKLNEQNRSFVDEDHLDDMSTFDEEIHEEELHTVIDAADDIADTDWSSCEEDIPEDGILMSGVNISEAVLMMKHMEYVNSVKEMMFSISLKDLQATLNEYIAARPDQLCAQFDSRASKAAAVQQYKEKQQLQTTKFPCESEQHFLEALNEVPTPAPIATSERKARHCRKCHMPMRGHPRGNCPSQE
eukprot:gene941-255_t